MYRSLGHKLPVVFPQLFTSYYSTNITQLNRRKRMLYRCKQRGLLELDLLLGTWADENIMSLDDKQLDQLDDIIKEENPDLHNYILQHEKTPSNIDNDIMKQLQYYVTKTNKRFTLKTGNQ